MDAILSLLEGFDLNNFIPPLDTVLGWVLLIARLAILVGPLLLLGLGLWYYFRPPKEANHSIGFRAFYGMGSVAAWQYTQKLAGLVWGAMGILLTIAMFIVSLTFGGDNLSDAVWAAFVCLIIEVVLVLLSVIVINVIVAIRYDYDGNLRKK